MSREVGRRKTLAFYWENIGPMHHDRLEALAAHLGPKWEVNAIQRASQSQVYGWDRSQAGRYKLHTLFDGLETPREWRLAPRLGKMLRLINPEALFLCDYQKPAVAINAWAQYLLGRKPVIMFDSKFDDFRRSIWKEVSKQPFLLPYWGALTASRRSRDFLVFHGLRPERIHFGYDTLSTERIRTQACSEKQPPFDQRNFVIVARLVPKKNLPLALEAYWRWRKDTGGTRALEICGSGPLEDDLRALAVRLGIAQSVRFHGFLQTTDIVKILSKSVCLLLPSYEEQFGLVVVESLAAGLPVIVSAQAGASDTIVRPGLNGFICRDDDAEGLAALMDLVTRDESYWQKLSKEASASAHACDVSAFVQSAEKIISQISRREAVSS